MKSTGNNKIKGTVFSLEKYAVHDGPGIRTLIFLKGCPLKCAWCDNPEGQRKGSQIFFITDRCIGCHQCLAVCPSGATTLSNGRVKINRKFCTACGKCVETCYAGARVLVGKSLSVEDVLEKIMADFKFYRISGGGVTLSGGEPLMQADFAREILRECQERNIHTAIETSGYADWESVKAVLKYVDLVLLDIKHMDTASHRQFTGVTNELILSNAQKIAALKIPMIIRVPVITGYNDDEGNIRATVEYVVKFANAEKIELLAYHPYGSPKYNRLGLKYRLRNLKPPSNESMEMIKEMVTSYGVKCAIS